MNVKSIESLSDSDLDLVIEIAKKASDFVRRVIGLKTGVSTLVNVLAVTHLNGMPLRLNDMKDGRMADICHDLGGILQNINMTTGRVEGSFVPRFAKNS